MYVDAVLFCRYLPPTYNENFVYLSIQFPTPLHIYLPTCNKFTLLYFYSQKNMSELKFSLFDKHKSQ